MHRILGVAALLVSITVAASVEAQQLSLVIDATPTASPYSAEVGRRRVFICKPNLPVQPIWGTDVYTDDSPICSAAMHAGVIAQAQGGVVTIVIGEARDTFTGSKRNGIESSGWPSLRRSYTFDAAGAGQLDWATSAAGLPTGFGTPIDVTCPPASATIVAGVTGIFGTDVYTADSPICVAALHAGAITLDGGAVHFVSRGAQTTFTSSTRNGVTSRSYGAWDASFAVSPVPQSLSRSAPVASTTTLTPPPTAPPQVLQPPTVNRTPTTMAGPVVSIFPHNTREGWMELTWQPIVGATGYRVTRVRNTGDPETTVAEGPPNTFVSNPAFDMYGGYFSGTCDERALGRTYAYCDYIDEDMTAGTTYSYRVFALFANNVISQPSAVVTAKTLRR